MDDFDDEHSGARRIKEEANNLVGGMGEHLSQHTVNRRYSAHFGATIHMTYLLWCMLDVENEGPHGATIMHLLWTLMFLKMYGTVDTLSTTAGVNCNTYRKWIWLLIPKIAGLDGLVSFVCVVACLHECWLY